MMPLSRLLNAIWAPSISLAGPSKLPSTGFHDSCTKGFHFLIRLAWESRYILPIVYAVVTFLFDLQMRLEIIVHRERRVIEVEEHVVEQVVEVGENVAEAENESDGTDISGQSQGEEYEPVEV